MYYISTGYKDDTVVTTLIAAKITAVYEGLETSLVIWYERDTIHQSGVPHGFTRGHWCHIGEAVNVEGANW